MPAVDPKSPLTILGASGVALLIFMLLPWYGIDTGDFGGDLGGGVDVPSLSAWEVFSYTDLLLFVTGAVAIASFVLSSQSNPAAGQAIQAATGLGGLMTLVVLFRMVNPPGDGGLNLKFGVFLGLIAAVGVAYGAFKSMSDSQGAA